MFDQTAEFRHDVATARMAALRRSAEKPPPRPRGRWRLSLPLSIVLTTVVLAALALGGRAAASDSVSAAPQAVELTFAGARVPADWGERDLGWSRTGTFSASAPLCAAGSASDVAHEFPIPVVAVRSFTCNDGSGTVSFRIGSFTAEEAADGGGTWAIVGGTGRYTTLRGAGRWATVAVDLTRPQVPSVRTRLTGIAAFDAQAPRIDVRRSSVTGRPGARILRFAFAAPDDVAGNAVSYRITTLAGIRVLSKTEGTTVGGRVVALSTPLRAAGAARRVRVVMTVVDPLGNERRLARPVALP
jgi:hypothetical protein